MLSRPKDPTKMSDSALTKAERALRAEFAKARADLAANGPPDHTVVAEETRKLAEKKARFAGVTGELRARELAAAEHERTRILEEWESRSAQMAGTPNLAQQKAERAAAKAKFDVERVAFHAHLKDEVDARNAETLERRRAAGLVYQATGQAGGHEMAALFSSDLLWGFLELRMNPTADGGQTHKAILTGPQISMLFWVGSVIAENRGEASFQYLDPPRWQQMFPGTRFRTGNDLQRLADVGLVEFEWSGQNHSLVTLRWGSRTKSLTRSYLKSIGKTNQAA